MKVLRCKLCEEIGQPLELCRHYNAVEKPSSNLRGLGDAVAMIAQPVAKAIDLSTKVLFPGHGTKLSGCGGCKQRQAKMNAALPFS